MAHKEREYPSGYSTAEFRKGMSTAFEEARYRDTIIDVHRHGRKWVSIVSPDRADILNKIELIGSLDRSEVAAALPKMTNSFEVNDLLEALNSLRNRSRADRKDGDL